jgi:hypothetical protein
VPTGKTLPSAGAEHGQRGAGVEVLDDLGMVHGRDQEHPHVVRTRVAHLVGADRPRGKRDHAPGSSVRRPLGVRSSGGRRDDQHLLVAVVDVVGRDRATGLDFEQRRAELGAAGAMCDAAHPGPERRLGQLDVPLG